MNEEEKSFYVRLGKEIANTRYIASITQGSLAKMLGKNRQSIHLLEKGRRYIDCHELSVISGILNVDPANFIRIK